MLLAPLALLYYKLYYHLLADRSAPQYLNHIQMCCLLSNICHWPRNGWAKTGSTKSWRKAAAFGELRSVLARKADAFGRERFWCVFQLWVLGLPQMQQGHDPSYPDGIRIRPNLWACSLIGSIQQKWCRTSEDCDARFGTLMMYHFPISRERDTLVVFGDARFLKLVMHFITKSRYIHKHGFPIPKEVIHTISFGDAQFLKLMMHVFTQTRYIHQNGFPSPKTMTYCSYPFLNNKGDISTSWQVMLVSRSVLQTCSS